MGAFFLICIYSVVSRAMRYLRILGGVEQGFQPPADYGF